VMELKDALIAKAAKYNRFADACNIVPKEGRSCKTCMRRHFSYPYTCNDGWPCGDPKWRDNGPYCRNWTDDPKAPVD
jgi:hypothetical protein